MFKKLANVTLIIFLFLQCSKTDHQFEDVEIIEPLQTVSYSENPEFTNIKLTCADSGLIAVDGRSNRIHQINYETLQLVGSAGRQGWGPGEFNGVYLADSYDGNLYVSDAGNQGIHILNEETLEYEFIIPVSLSATRFSVQSGFIYSPAPYSKTEYALQMIGLDDHSVHYFSERSGAVFPGRDMYHALANDTVLYAVSLTEPVIKMYTREGELITTQNFADELLLSESLQFSDRFYREPGNENRSVILFQDAALFQNYLVVNVINHSEGSHNRSAKYNNYLLFQINGESLKRAGAFRTNIGERGITSTFCIQGTRLYSTGGRNGVNIYEFDLSVFE